MRKIARESIHGDRRNLHEHSAGQRSRYSCFSIELMATVPLQIEAITFLVKSLVTVQCQMTAQFLHQLECRTWNSKVLSSMVPQWKPQIKLFQRGKPQQEKEVKIHLIVHINRWWDGRAAEITAKRQAFARQEKCGEKQQSVMKADRTTLLLRRENG